MVSNCPGVKLFAVSNCPMSNYPVSICPGVKLSANMGGVNLSAASNCPGVQLSVFTHGVKLSPNLGIKLVFAFFTFSGWAAIWFHLFIIHKCHKYNFNVFTHVKFKIDSNTKDLKGKWKGRSSAKNFLSQDCKTLPSHAFRSIQQNSLKQDNCTS